MSASEENIKLAKYVNSLTGGNLKVFGYGDDEGLSKIDLILIRDFPVTGVVTQVTVGLSDYATGLIVEGTPLGVELIMSYNSTQEYGAQVLATCAFNLIKSKMIPKPGATFLSVLGLYKSDIPMNHVLFVSPFQIDVETQNFSKKKVAWLAAIPISEAEYQYINTHGVERFEEEMERKVQDIYDLERDSIV